jgi:hypothetical protein
VSCARCGSQRLFQFEASKSAVVPETLPLVCRDCGQISIGGTAVHFPPAMEQHAKDLAELAGVAGKEAKEELLADPDQRIEIYFANVYRRAYLEGFWRALLFWRHNGKEGRLRRVRELWGDHRPMAQLAESVRIAIDLPKTAYDELRQLLELGDHHAPRPANERPSPPPRRPRVPRRTR